MDDPILYERRGRLGLVTLNRPASLNALVPAMLDMFRVVVADAERDPAVLCVAVTGAGRGFCAGAALEQIEIDATQGTVWGRAPDARPPDGETSLLFSQLLGISKPVIALVNGAAAGGGFILAVMSDLRFAADGAFFTAAFSARGLIAEHGTSWLLPRLIGTSRALDLLWTSRRVGAAEALAMGLVDRVLPAQDLVQAAVTYADDLAAIASPRSLAEMKLQVYADLSRPFGPAADDAHHRLVASLSRPDVIEGGKAFAEKRRPQFQPWRGWDRET